MPYPLDILAGCEEDIELGAVVMADGTCVGREDMTEEEVETVCARLEVAEPVTLLLTLREATEDEGLEESVCVERAPLLLMLREAMEDEGLKEAVCAVTALLVVLLVPPFTLPLIETDADIVPETVELDDPAVLELLLLEVVLINGWTLEAGVLLDEASELVADVVVVVAVVAPELAENKADSRTAESGPEPFDSAIEL